MRIKHKRKRSHMGSSELWEQISQYEPPRIAFKKFVSDFVEEKGRFPRIAVDGYLWLFECGYFDEPKNMPKVLLNWLTKLKEFLQLRCYIVVIFDSTFKIDGKRQKRRNDATLWNSYWLMRSIHQARQSSINYVDSSITLCCKMLNVQMINAPGEGEAQCAYLQRFGEVDYVLSNDADVLSFGATKILKNYSKHGWEDIPNSTRSPKKSKQTERFITFVDMDNILDWDQNRFILFNLLVGSDYNNGVKNFGGKRAAILCKCRDPDFSKRLSEALSNVSFHGKNEADSKWDEFGKYILRVVQEKSKSLFGMNLKSMVQLKKFIDWPSVTVGLFYKEAIVEKNIKLPHRGNSMSTEHDIESFSSFLKSNEINRYVSDLSKWLHDYLHYCNLLDFIWRHPDPFNGTYRLTEYRDVSLCDGLHKYKEVCVRYKSFLHVPHNSSEKIPQETPSIKRSRSESPIGRSPRSPAKSIVLRSKYPNYLWLPTGTLPKPLLEHLNKELSDNIERRENTLSLSSPKRSPCKRSRGSSLSPQKSTLDRFLTKRPCLGSAAKNLTSALLQEREKTSEQISSSVNILSLDEQSIPEIPYINLVDSDSDYDSGSSNFVHM